MRPNSEQIDPIWPIRRHDCYDQSQLADRLSADTFCRRVLTDSNGPNVGEFVIGEWYPLRHNGHEQKQCFNLVLHKIHDAKIAKKTSLAIKNNPAKESNDNLNF